MRVNVEESFKNVTLIVERLGGTIGKAYCGWNTDTSDGKITNAEDPPSAQEANDILAVKDVLEFAEGVRTQEIVIPIVDDDVAELDEQFTVFLEGATNKATIDPRSNVATVVIRQNDDPNGRFRFVSEAWSVTEAVGKISLEVQRGDERVYSDMSVAWNVVERVASQGFSTVDDIVKSSGVLTIPKGKSSGDIFIQVRDDGKDEIEEKFDVVLSAPPAESGAVLGNPHRATVSIETNGSPHGMFSDV